MLVKWKLLEEAEEGRDLPGAQPQEPQTPVDDKWADFLTEEEDLFVESESPESPEETQLKEEEPPAQPAPAEPVQPAQEPVVAPEAPVQTAVTPEQVKEFRDRFQASLVDHYKFSEDDALALQTEPEKVLPQMAARLHMEVLDNVMQHVYQALPTVIESTTQGSVREQKAQEEFYGAWPELREHGAQVLQMGQMYRQMNPKATPQEAIQRIGELTMVALGLKRAEAPGAQAPETPAAPFRPAAPGRVSAPPSPKNKWEAVMDDD